jgi:hypothetical protein
MIFARQAGKNTRQQSFLYSNVTPFQVPENWQRTTRLAAPRWQRDSKNIPPACYPLVN